MIYIPNNPNKDKKNKNNCEPLISIKDTLLSLLQEFLTLIKNILAFLAESLTDSPMELPVANPLLHPDGYSAYAYLVYEVCTKRLHNMETVRGVKALEDVFHPQGIIYSQSHNSSCRIGTYLYEVPYYDLSAIASNLERLLEREINKLAQIQGLAQVVVVVQIRPNIRSLWIAITPVPYCIELGISNADDAKKRIKNTIK